MTRLGGMQKVAGAGVAVLLSMALAGPAAATSCIPIDAQLKDLPSGSVVFVGTVLTRDVAAVKVRAEQWYAGSDPRDTVTIPIAAPGEPVIVGAWEPSPGQRWFIIGDRTGPDVVDSGVCRQMPAAPELLATATSLFGPPQQPPFEEPDEADGTASTPAGPPLLLLAVVLALGALGGLGAVVIAQRRLA